MIEDILERISDFISMLEEEQPKQNNKLKTASEQLLESLWDLDEDLNLMPAYSLDDRKLKPKTYTYDTDDTTREIELKYNSYNNFGKIRQLLDAIESINEIGDIIPVEDSDVDYAEASYLNLLCYFGGIPITSTDDGICFNCSNCDYSAEPIDIICKNENDMFTITSDITSCNHKDCGFVFMTIDQARDLLDAIEKFRSEED